MKPDELAEWLLGRVEVGDCWLWGGARTGGRYGGYAQATVGGRNHYVHRLVYESLVGPIAKELQIDHLCRVRACVNPDHLEAVTSQTNVRRRWGSADRCKRGHAFVDTYDRPDGRGTQCRACQRENGRTHRARTKVAA